MGRASDAEPSKRKKIEDSVWVSKRAGSITTKKNYRVYEQAESGTGAKEIVMSPKRHGLAKLARVPLVELRGRKDCGC